MRVLFVGTNAGGGGTETHFVSLARALAEAGHEVSAAVRPDDFIHRGLAEDDHIQLFDLTFRGRRDLRAMRDLLHIVRRVKPDWIVGAFKNEYWGVSLVAKIAGTPVVLFSHVDHRIGPMLLNDVTRLVRRVIVPSQYLRQRAIQRGLPAGRITVLPNPVDVGRFKANPALRASMRASLGLADDDLLFGYVGRFDTPKGVTTLAHALNAAMRKHSRIHALWLGHGKLEQQLRTIAAEAGFAKRHHWLPWRDDVLPAYAAMDALSLSSEGSESFGRVLIEAQAYGIPVFGARNGGIPEALADGMTGHLLEPGDVGVWADAIGDLAANDSARLRLGASARGFALRFDSQRIVAEFIRVLESLSHDGAVDASATLAPEVAGD